MNTADVLLVRRALLQTHSDHNEFRMLFWEHHSHGLVAGDTPILGRSLKSSSLLGVDRTGRLFAVEGIGS